MTTPTPTTAMIAQLRRMVVEPDTTTYSTSVLSTILAGYPLPDADGLDSDDALWAGAWDLNQAAADIWEEKAAAAAVNFDFAADGGDYKRSQVQAQMLKMAQTYRAKRSTGSLVMKATPKPLGAVRLESWIGNLSETATEDYD
jgi:hypothetical protein